MPQPEYDEGGPLAETASTTSLTDAMKSTPDRLELLALIARDADLIEAKSRIPLGNLGISNSIAARATRLTREDLERVAEAVGRAREYVIEAVRVVEAAGLGGRL